MTTLHRRYRGIAASTDVLSFDVDTDPKHGVLNADIVVCADLARQRAAARTLAASRAELALYVTHGILHLAGYDDHRPADFRRMHAREDELLSELGLGPVFSRGTRAPPQSDEHSRDRRRG